MRGASDFAEQGEMGFVRHGGLAGVGVGLSQDEVGLGRALRGGAGCAGQGEVGFVGQGGLQASFF